jgi:NADH-quinone oxidoreductase subunit M
MGLPLLNGFIGEFTILQGAFMANRTWAIWSVAGVVLAAAYLLWLYQRVFFGQVTNEKNAKLKDLTPRELATFVPLVILAFWIGVYPKPFFRVLDKPVTEIVQKVNADWTQQKPVLATTPEQTPALEHKPAEAQKAPETKPLTTASIAAK